MIQTQQIITISPINKQLKAIELSFNKRPIGINSTSKVSIMYDFSKSNFIFLAFCRFILL